MSYTIRYSDNIHDLTGRGEEWLVDSAGNVRAIFIDGMIKPYYISDNKTSDEETKPAA